MWGEFTGHRWIPHTKASNAEKVSIWWRHHAQRVIVCNAVWKSNQNEASFDVLSRIDFYSDRRKYIPANGLHCERRGLDNTYLILITELS